MSEYEIFVRASGLRVSQRTPCLCVGFFFVRYVAPAPLPAVFRNIAAFHPSTTKHHHRRPRHPRNPHKLHELH